MLREEMKKEQPRHPEREGESKAIRKEEQPRLHKHIPEEVKRHILPPQEELEIMINLCGNKKELIDVLNHINHLIVDTPKEIRSEVKVKKLK